MCTMHSNASDAEQICKTENIMPSLTSPQNPGDWTPQAVYRDTVTSWKTSLRSVVSLPSSLG